MGAPEIEVLDPVHAEPTTSLTLYDAIEAGLTELRTAGARPST